MLNRRLIKLALPLAVGALVLGACGGKKKDDTSSTPTGGTEKPTYSIGYQGPLSGENQQLGINMDNAVQLAIELANKAGDLPFTLKFEHSDDMGAQDKGQAAAQLLIDNANVIGVVGPAFSGATKAALPSFAAANLASVSPSATNPDLTNRTINPGFTTFFRVVAPDDLQGPAAADYISKVLKATKVYSVNDKGEYGVGLAKTLEEQLTKNGTPFVTDAVAIGGVYDSMAAKIAGSGADVLYYSGYYADLAKLAKAARAAGYKGVIMSDDGGKDDQYTSQAGGSVAEGTLFSCACFDASQDSNAQSFVDAYTTKFKEAPGTYSAESFDAANTIIAAMKSLNKADITRAEVVEALKTVEYKGLTATIKFAANGDGENKAVFIYEVKDGKIVQLGNYNDLIK